MVIMKNGLLKNDFCHYTQILTPSIQKKKNYSNTKRPV